MASWREEWENRGFEAPLSRTLEDWLRVRFLKERGTVRRFTAQYEVSFEGVTYPVVRWDTAHGFVHRDTLDWEGRTVDKRPFYGKTYNAGLTEAIADIRQRWSIYRDAVEARKPA